MRKAYRIISIEAADIYRQEQENGVAIGYKMPESKSDAYFILICFQGKRETRTEIIEK